MKRAARSFVSIATIIAYLAPLVPRTAYADTAPTSSASEVVQGQAGLGASEGDAAGPLSSVSVDPSTGILNEGYAFAVPKARGDVQPQLGLGYSSLAGTGVAGQGWDLTLPTIERHNVSGKPRYQDPGPLTFNPTTVDRFTYAGQWLTPICVVTSSCTGAAAGEVMPTWATGWIYYRLETEDGSMMRFFWSSNHQTWRVQLKSGAIMEFGVPLDSPQELPSSDLDTTNSVDVDASTSGTTLPVFRWNLVRQYDTHRLPSGRATNLIVYKWGPYPGPNGSEGQRASLTDVYYSPPITDAPRALSTFAHHVHFNYALAPAHPLALQTPMWKAQTHVQLQNVDVTSNDFNGDAARYQVRRYWLEYSWVDSANGNFFPNQQLTSIQMEGTCAVGSRPADGALPSAASCDLPMHPPTVFSYTHEGSAPVVTDIGHLPPTQGVAVPAIQDVNSDGFPDIILRTAGPATSTTVLLNSLVAQGAWASKEIVASGGLLNEVAGTFNPSSIQYNTGSFSPTGTMNILWFGSYGSGMTSNTIPYDIFMPVSVSGGTTWEWRYQLSGSFSLYQVPNSADNATTYGSALDAAAPDVYVTDEEKYANVDIDGDGYVDMMTTADYSGISSVTLPSAPLVRLLGSRLTQVDAIGNVQPFVNDPGVTITSVSGGAVGYRPNTCVAGLTTTAQLFPSGTGITIADYNGDGLPDWIQLGSTSVTVWLGHGDGTFGTGGTAGQICTTGSGTTVFNVPSGISLPYLTAGHFDDVTGDGFADLIVPTATGFTVYPNNPITGLGETSIPVSLQNAPLSWANGTGITYGFADMDANGVDDVVLLNQSVGSGYQDMAYVDIVGADLPGLLNKVDNGLGGVANITYASSASLSVGQSWSSTSPQSIHVVTSVTTTNSLPSPDTTTVNYTYSNAVYDPRDRQFIGFRNVVEETVGDADGPTSYVSTNFNLDTCSFSDFCDGADYPYRSIRALPVLTETYQLGATVVTTGGTSTPRSYLMTTHRSFTESPLYAGLDGRYVHLVLPSAVDTWSYGPNEGAGGTQTTIPDVTYVAGSTTLTDAAPFNIEAPNYAQSHLVMKADGFGNIKESDDFGYVGANNASQDGIVQTARTWSVVPDDSGGNWMWRVTYEQVEGVDATLATATSTPRSRTISYDAEGNAKGATAPLYGTSLLARTPPSTGASVAPAPTNASAYSGTVTLGSITYDSAGNPTRVQGADNRCTDLGYDTSFDELLTLKETYVGGCGSGALVTAMGYDGTLGLITQLWAPDGALTTTGYDGYGRVHSVALPNPTAVGSSSSAYLSVNYADLAGSGTLVTSSVTDGTNVTTSWKYLDGFGRFVGGVQSADTHSGDQQPYIRTPRPKRGAKGQIVSTYPPVWSSSDGSQANYSFGTGAFRHVTFDPFARPIQATDLDGTVMSQVTYQANQVQTMDAEQLKTSGPHVGGYSVVQFDGHGRPIVSSKVTPQGTTTTTLTRIPTGEISTLTRTGPNAPSYVRSFDYDSLGRLVWNIEPNTGYASSSAQPTGWRYAYDDAGDLVGTSDARGCGENRAYDGAGRLVSEDYSPCTTGQPTYSAPGADGVAMDGTEVYRVFDAVIPNPDPTDGAPASINDGHLYSVYDRAASTYFAYDSRGRVTSETRWLAKPLAPGAAVTQVSQRYESASSTIAIGYDALNRIVSQTTGADQADLLGSGGLSQVTTTYSARGTVKSVQGAYGTLIAAQSFDTDGLPLAITYGDTGADTDGDAGNAPTNTQTTFAYDARRRLQEMKTSRAAPSLWTGQKNNATYTAPTGTDALTTLATVLQDDVVPYTTGTTNDQYDAVNNVLQLNDDRLASEWGPGAAPVATRTMVYDDWYRLTNITQTYATASTKDVFSSPSPAASSSVSPLPVTSLTNRVNWQTFQYDGLGNLTASADDASAFFDRSLGTITNGSTSSTTATGPNQIASAAGSGSSGALASTYDAAGNLVQLAVDRGTNCVGSAPCSQLFRYDWDEVGLLARARRFDYAGGFHCGLICVRNPVPTGVTYPTLPTFAASADVSYAYDGTGARVLRASTQASGSVAYSAEIFPSLRLELTSWNETSNTYGRSDETEAVYLISDGHSYGRLAYGPSLPSPSGTALHVFLELSDGLGSTTTVIDKETSEVVERTTNMAFGATESDSRPPRWQSFRDPYKYTGKEDDVEIGVTYFGSRYYSPQLQRWISPDPSTIHGLSSDLNPYAFVNGSPYRYADPDGLDPCDYNGVYCVNGGGSPVTIDLSNVDLGNVNLGGVGRALAKAGSVETTVLPGVSNLGDAARALACVFGCGGGGGGDSRASAPSAPASPTAGGAHGGSGASGPPPTPAATKPAGQVGLSLPHAAFDPWANASLIDRWLFSSNSAVANWATNDANLQKVQDGAQFVATQAAIMAATGGAGEVFEGLNLLAKGGELAEGVGEVTEAGDVAEDAFTFRGDTRAPDTIFNEGFQPRGDSTDLLAHALDNTSPPSAFVSTSQSAEVAGEFADQVYVVRPTGGINVNEALGPASPFPHELEVAVPGGIPASNVRAVTMVSEGVSYLNPNWVP